jgi:signal peptidase II
MPSSHEPAAAESAPAPPHRRPARRGLVTLLAVLALVVAAIDQVTKVWAERTLAGEPPIDVIGEFLRFRLIYNSGAAFSIGTGVTWLFTLAMSVVVVVIIVIAVRVGSRTWAIALGLVLGGAVGNLIDRVFREPGFPEGHVVDFIDYNGWFVGNVADIGIVVAMGLIMILSFRGVPLAGRPAAATDDGAA